MPYVHPHPMSEVTKAITTEAHAKTVEIPIIKIWERRGGQPYTILTPPWHNNVIPRLIDENTYKGEKYLLGSTSMKLAHMFKEEK